MDFRAAYFRLYAEMASSIEEMQEGHYDKALARLILTQLNEEENYMNAKSRMGIAYPKKGKPPTDPER